MPTLLIRHKVADFVDWKSIFDELGPMRHAFGCKGSRLFRDVTDVNDLLVFMEWDDGERARLYAQSDELQEALMRSGVIDQPDWWVLEEIDGEGAPTT